MGYYYSFVLYHILYVVLICIEVVVRCLRESDGKKNFVDVVNSLNTPVEEHVLHDMLSCAGGVPYIDLLMIGGSGSVVQLHGFPPWMLRHAELAPCGHLSKKEFRRCFERYANCQQRLGK